MRYICIRPFYPDQTSPQRGSYSSFLNSPVARFKQIGSSMTKTYGNNTSKQKMTQLTEKTTRWGENTLLCAQKRKSLVWTSNQPTLTTYYGLRCLLYMTCHLGCVCLGPNHASQTNMSSFFGANMHFSWKLCVCPDVRMFAKQIYSMIFSAAKRPSQQLP